MSSDIEILHIERIVLDELPARRDLVAHEEREQRVGLRGIRFEFRGQQNHAGTTMMARRQDASTALYEFAYRVNQEFPKVAGERSVWTMGRVKVHPNATRWLTSWALIGI